MSTQKISRSELIGLFMSKKCRPITVTYRTDSRLLKTGNPHKNVEKRVVMNGQVGYDYARALEKRTAEAGENPASAKEIHARTWGSRVGETSIIEHKGKSYLDVMVNNLIETSYQDLDSGKTLTYDEVKDFLPNKSNSLVPVTNIGIDKIEMIKVDGVEYEVS